MQEMREVAQAAGERPVSSGARQARPASPTAQTIEQSQDSAVDRFSSD